VKPAGYYESGTVAAGATTDHPFFYAIEDDKTGELLFIGVLMNPS
jgi:serine protease inhibitor